MKKKPRTIKRTHVKEIRRTDSSICKNGGTPIDEPDCTGTPVVDCNQWVCYSHDLCVSDGSSAEKKAVLAENK